MLHRNRIVAAAAGLALLGTLATGCLYLRYTFVPAPGKSVTLMGFLDASQPTWTRPEADCRLDDESQPGFFYEVFLVQNTGIQTRTIQITADWINEDGFLHVFDNSADPGESLAGCLVGNDDDPTFLQSRIEEIAIEPGEVLMVVISTFEPGVTIEKINLTITTLVEAE